MRLLGFILTSCLVAGCNFNLQPWQGSLNIYDEEIYVLDNKSGSSFKLEAGTQYQLEMIQTIPNLLSTTETWTVYFGSVTKKLSVSTNLRAYFDKENIVFSAKETGQAFDLKVAYLPEVNGLEEYTYAEGDKCFTRYVFTDEVEVEFLAPETQIVLADGLLANTYTRVKEVTKNSCL